MRRVPKNTGVWHYLNETGVLEHGTEEEIEKARKAYRKNYVLEYRRKQRKEGREHTIGLRKEEKQKLKEAAKNHHMTINRFMKTAALAYISKTYLAPNEQQVATIEQTLIQILNEIQAIAKRNKFLFSLNPLAIEKRISRMETEITDALRNPKEKLPIHLLTHDRQNQNPENTELQTGT